MSMIFLTYRVNKKLEPQKKPSHDFFFMWNLPRSRHHRGGDKEFFS